MSEKFTGLFPTPNASDGGSEHTHRQIGMVTARMRVGQTRKRDQNERAIVDALRRVGAFVMRASIEGGPDLLVLWRGTVHLVECKATTGTPTHAQQQTAKEGWPIATVRSPQDALAILGVRAL